MWLSIGLYLLVGTVLLGMLGIMVLYTVAEYHERRQKSVLSALNFCEEAAPAATFINRTECRL